MIGSKFDGPQIVSVNKIWDKASHNGMTDLIYFQNKWFCTFRESDKHAFGIRGVIRIISSEDLLSWNSIAFFAEDEIDLRDPKLSLTSDGQLMLLVGGSLYDCEGKYLSCQSRVSFSEDGFQWKPFHLILQPHEWLWRVTWHRDRAYGVSYRRSNITNTDDEWLVNLFESSNGIDYTLLSHWNISGYPNETTLRFTKAGEMIALLRRDNFLKNQAWIGNSLPPFTDWTWHVTDHYFGGPNFLILDDESRWAGGRMIALNPYGLFEKTVLAKMELDQLSPQLILPSGGDTSYPGMIYHNNLLWMSYYSSHEGHASIYLASIDLPNH